MSETNKDQSQESITTVEKSTIIYDAAQSVSEMEFRPGFPTHLDYPKPSLDYLIGRPFLYGTYQWTNIMSIGDTITNNKGIVFPRGLTYIDEINELLKFHNYFRPQCRILIKVNGTAMHYGKLVAYYGWPDPSLRMTRKVSNDAILKSCYNYEWTQISANSTQVTTLHAPYLGPFDMVPTKAFETPGMSDVIANAMSTGYFDIRVAVPLGTISNASTTLDVSVFIIVDDLGRTGIAPGAARPFGKSTATSVTTSERKLTAQMYDAYIADTAEPLHSTIQSGGSNETVQSSERRVLPSKIARDLGRWFGSFTPIPFVGTLATIGKETSYLTSTILRALGFSVPTNVCTPQQIIVSQDRLIQYDTVANSVALAPEPAPFVSKDISVLGSKFCDYDITSYCSHSMLLDTFKIKGDQISGEVLFVLPIRPSSMCTYEQIGMETNMVKVMIPTRMAYMQRFFDFWRGSMRFHLSIAASRFHSGRIRITWVPTYDKVFASGEDIFYDNYLAAYPSILLDIAGDTDVSFTVPYFQPQNWLNTSYPFDIEDRVDPWKMDNNGILIFTVVNRLVVADSSATAGVFAQLFVGGGPDLQFAFPNLDPNGKMGFPTRLPSAVTPRQGFTAQMGDLSSDMLKKASARPIYDIPKGSKEEHITQSTNTVSIKQLMNMGGPVFQFTAPATTIYEFKLTFNWSSATICQFPPDDIPPDSAVEDYIYHASINNYAFNIAPLRALTRGGYRVQFIAPSGASETVATYTAVTATSVDDLIPDGCVHVSAVRPDIPLSMHDLYSSQGCHWYKQFADQNITLDIPYYGITRAVPALYWIYESPPIENPFVTGVLTIRRRLQQGQNVVINVAYGDDAQLAYDITLPFVVDKISYVPPPQPPARLMRRSISQLSKLDEDFFER